MPASRNSQHCRRQSLCRIAASSAAPFILSIIATIAIAIAHRQVVQELLQVRQPLLRPAKMPGGTGCISQRVCDGIALLRLMRGWRWGCWCWESKRCADVRLGCIAMPIWLMLKCICSTGTCQRTHTRLRLAD